MRVLIVLVLTASMVLLVSGEIQAFDAQPSWTGNELKKWIDASEKVDKEPSQINYLYSGNFHGYVSGVADMGSESLFCLPELVSRKQLGDIVAKYVNQNPEQRHKPALFFVLKALTQAFPCGEDAEFLLVPNPKKKK